MTLLNRHIFQSVLFVSVSAVALFAFVLMAGNAIRDLISPLAAGQISGVLFIRMLLLLVPFVASYALPLGILTAVLLVLGRMSAQHEIVAMRTAGLGLSRIGAPIVFLAALGCALAVVINFYYAPNARSQYRELLAQAVRANPLSFIVEQTFIRDFPNYVLYVGDKRGTEMRDFWIWQLDEEERVVAFVRAETGRFTFDEDQNALRLMLQHGRSEIRDPRRPEDIAERQLAVSFESSSLLLSLDRILGRETFRKKLSWMNYNELMRERQAAQEGDPELTPEENFEQLIRVQSMIQEKFALAFSVLSFALLGIPLGIKLQRKETSANLGAALILALGYYFLMIWIGWFDNQPHLRPDLLLWVPNLGFQLIGVWLLSRVR